jgi:glycosyltransferase involved in cell wall biosynthesis
VWGIHNASFKQLGFWSRLQIYAGGALAGVVPNLIVNCSRRSAEIHAAVGYARASVAIIPNGYEAAVFRPDERSRHEIRGQLGIGPDLLLVGSITRWIDYKDVPTLLRALRASADRNVRLTCLLIGHGLSSENQELNEAINATGCENLVVPLGVRDDVQELARAMDLHVLPSLTEAFPNVVAETMLSGVPNIVTDVGDSALIVGETGWVVPAGSADAIADAMLEAAREFKEASSAWNRRRAAARARIAENFSFEGMAAAYERVWRSVALEKATVQRRSS